MKYICLGYHDEKQWETLSESDRNRLIDECFTYDDMLRRNGHFAGGEALQSARNATTVQWKNGKACVTDGPYAETKEQLGGILILEARDLNHAIQLMSNHPGIKSGPFEIRPVEDLSQMIRESELRRGVKAADEGGSPRQIGSLTVTTPSGQEIAMSRTFNAPRRQVFDALIEPELIRQWMLGSHEWTMPVCENDVRVGGTLRFMWRDAEGKTVGVRGTYREVTAPERLVHTELFDEDWTGGETLVTNVLTEQNGGTMLTMTVRYPSREIRDKVLESGMERCIAASYDRLEELLEPALVQG